MKLIAQNRKARHDYEILERLEAGIALTGPEIKAIRAGKVNLTGSYGKILQGEKGKAELFWLGGHIEVAEGDPARTRKLLVHRKEIEKLIGATREKGLTLVPLRLYFKGSHAKLELGIGRGLKKADRRELLRRRAQEREIERALKK